MGMFREKEVWISRSDFEMNLLRVFKESMNIPIYSHKSAFSVINPATFKKRINSSAEEIKENLGEEEE